MASDPGAVERDRALWLLTERAVLTRSVCRELSGAGDAYVIRRTRAALNELLRPLFMLLTADTAHQADGDRVRPCTELLRFWCEHPAPTVAPD